MMSSASTPSAPPHDPDIGGGPALPRPTSAPWLRLRLDAGQRRRLLVAASLVALFAAVRALFLTADPPLGMPHDASATDLFVEPAAKAHEARNWALFGAWKTSPVDNYQFWRAQSPAWVYPLAGFLRTFGVSYASLRSFAVLTSTLGFAALLGVAALKLRGPFFACAGLLAACNYTAVIYDRSAMIEPAVNAHLTFTVLLLLLSRRHMLWLIPAQWAFVTAFLTKQTGLLLAPVVLGFGVSAWLGAAGAGDRRRAYRILVLVHAAALLAAVGYYVSRDAYVRSVLWNYGRVVHGGDERADMVSKGVSALNLLRTVTDPEKFHALAWILMLPGALALAEVIRVAARAVRRRPVDAWSACVALWWLSALGALLATRVVGTRYFLIMLPPTALLAASFIQWAALRVPRRPARVAAVVAVMTLAIAPGAVSYAGWASKRSSSIVEANRRVAKLIGDRPAVVIGLWSAPLVFETPYHHYYVKNDFNAKRKALVALGVTHLLLLDRSDYTRSILNREFRGLLKKLKPKATIRIRGSRVRLFELKEPLK